MKYYGKRLCSHLSEYKKRRLGIDEDGTWDYRFYPHILPDTLGKLNFVEAYRAEIGDHLRRHPEIKLHHGWRHLNSSQVFSFNLFYPFFADQDTGKPALCSALGAPCATEWDFEFIFDSSEGTNVDVKWDVKEGSSVFCEVKLSENGFGTAKDDERHQQKLKDMYFEKLNGLVSPDLLAKSTFLQNYQLLRYIWLLARNSHRLIFLFPRENETLDHPLNTVLAQVTDDVRARISIVHIEDCLRRLRRDTSLPPLLKAHVSQLEEKYIIPPVLSSA